MPIKLCILKLETILSLDSKRFPTFNSGGNVKYLYSYLYNDDFAGESNRQDWLWSNYHCNLIKKITIKIITSYSSNSTNSIVCRQHSANVPRDRTRLLVSGISPAEPKNIRRRCAVADANQQVHHLQPGQTDDPTRQAERHTDVDRHEEHHGPVRFARYRHSLRRRNR